MAKFLARLSQTFQKDKTASKAVFGVGTMIDERYRLDGEIGHGGMGIVFRAHDIPNERDVAVKVIEENSVNALTLGQFARESKIMQQLQHPHIVRVFETGVVENGVDQPLPFIVMELLKGTLLNDIHEFTFARIVNIGKQVGEALAYIHEQGFLYRDLKPGNVMLEKCGFHYCVKLFDFGLARPRGEAYLPNESYRAGTVFYLAPELIAGQPADTGADLYALGATLYEMITGRVPFFNIDEEHILEEHLEESVSPPSQSRSDVPPALEAIVLRLLEKDPQDRFASAREVCEALDQVTVTNRSNTRGNLPPSQVDGRDNEIEQVIHLFESHQVVTLLNDDQQLALAIGTRLMDEFPDGIWLVEVAAVDEPIMLLPTVASLLGVRGDGHRSLTIALLEFLRERQLLLIFKQCHYLLPACSQLVETIIETCPEVYILGTSTLPLNVQGETCYRGQAV